MIWDDWGWSGMIWDDSRWFWMIWDDLGWFGMIWDDLGWFWMICDDLGWFGMIWGDLGWFGMIWDDLGWFGVIWDDLGWSQDLLRTFRGGSVPATNLGKDMTLPVASLCLCNSTSYLTSHAILETLSGRANQGKQGTSVLTHDIYTIRTDWCRQSRFLSLTMSKT